MLIKQFVWETKAAPTFHSIQRLLKDSKPCQGVDIAEKQTKLSNHVHVHILFPSAQKLKTFIIIFLHVTSWVTDAVTGQEIDRINVLAFGDGLMITPKEKENYLYRLTMKLVKLINNQLSRMNNLLIKEVILDWSLFLKALQDKSSDSSPEELFVFSSDTIISLNE